MQWSIKKHNKAMVKSKFWGRAVGILALLISAVNVHASQFASSQELTRGQLTQHIGQKLMLDMRYFCLDGTPSKQCRTPVTTLPEELAHLIVSRHIGGVILFSENLVSERQITALTDSLQQLATDHQLPPLFIGVDQEGGRVARVPAQLLRPFPGNMPLGALPSDQQISLTEAAAKHTAAGLRKLGINLNFAPNVDVNVNPDNPVINIRSFSDSPERVASLGAAVSRTLEQQGIFSTLKHFPGHGDTRVDSHTGLPAVTHPITRLNEVELYPFRSIIQSNTPPTFVMSAHIQFPSLDNTTLTTKSGEQAVVPATLSHRILTGLLRDEWGYEGLVITDALDMAGIAHYFSQGEALRRAFAAGVDIALMPYELRTPADVRAFLKVLDALEREVAASPQLSRQVLQSAQRIATTKTRIPPRGKANSGLSSQHPQQHTSLSEQRQTARTIAQHSVTDIYHAETLALPLSGKGLVVMPDKLRCLAFEQGFTGLSLPDANAIRCVELSAHTQPLTKVALANLDYLIIGDISPTHSRLEMGGLMPDSGRGKMAKGAQLQWYETAIALARLADIPVVFIAMRSPFVVEKLTAQPDLILATYHYVATLDSDERVTSPMMDALMAVLYQGMKPKGQLPVTLRH